MLSITTTRGRLKFPLFFGERQRQQLANALTIQGGQLVRTKRGEWYMHLSVRMPVAETKATGRIVGCDFGQRTLAVLSSNGTRYGGGNPKTTRLHYKAKRAEVRTKLDTQRSKGTKRLFARLSGKEARYTRAVLHEVSRRIVDSLEPGDTFAIEDLTGLRKNTTRRGKEARGLHNLWPYFQFRQYLEYKCALKSVTVIAVEARNTSKTCSRCGHCDKANRKRQALFRCVQCGYQDSADKNASLNIAQRAGSLGIGVCNDASNSSVSRTVTVRGLKAA